ncbi:MAG TPA: phosphatase PAP2 family protein [Amnibacterium sp.]|nr:phosphatase PAP2 family protein [Amnibacterium sp.]
MAFVAGLTLLAVWAGAATFADAPPTPRLDHAWAHAIARVHTPVLDTAAGLLSVVGGFPGGIVVGALLAVVILRRRGVLPASIFVVAALLSEADVLLLKVVSHRVDPGGTVFAGLGSFPSGHVANAAVIAVTAAVLVPRGAGWLPGAGYVLLMALDRTYLRAHWLTDTLAGAAAGGAVAALAWSLLLVIGTPDRVEVRHDRAEAMDPADRRSRDESPERLSRAPGPVEARSADPVRPRRAA